MPLERTFRETCQTCGSIYKVEQYSLPLRDKDSQACEVCQAILRRWNGGVMYGYELVEKAEWAEAIVKLGHYRSSHQQ